MREKKKLNSEIDRSAETDNDPVTKLRERLRLIQDKVGKVMEKVSVPDPTRKPVEENIPKCSFDMAAWQREREKIRSSRFFEDAEVQPYARKQFEQIEIRAGKISNEIKLSNGFEKTCLQTIYFC
jgi:hypothetical protein